MNESNKEIIKQILINVAQNFAFMFADDLEESQDTSPPYVKAEMSFSGPYKGKSIVIAPELLCNTMMNNVLGIDENELNLGIEPKDALCEFLNIFCGNLLTTIAGTEPIFELNPPIVNEIDEKEWEEVKNDADFIQLSLDDYPIYISVKYEKV